jgi:hypothetical protein
MKRPSRGRKWIVRTCGARRVGVREIEVQEDSIKSDDVFVDSPGQFAAAFCDKIDFEFGVEDSGFDGRKFHDAMEAHGVKSLGEGTPTFGICNTESPTVSDFHVHFLFYAPGTDRGRFSVSYHKGASPAQPGESSPFAEHFMQWAGQFFKSDAARAYITALFEYPVTLRQSRFLLPVRVDIIPGMNTTIDGISIDFVEKPEGLYKARLTIDPEDVNVQMAATTLVNFAGFDIVKEVGKFSTIAAGLTDVRKT